MNSDSFFRPDSVAVIGASEEPGRIGSGLVRSMLPCVRELFCVNPNHETLYGRPCYRSVLELPERPSHAYIAVRRDFVLPHLRDCARAGIRNVVIISSGFKETDAAGAALEAEIAALARAEGMTVLGPNTLGFLNTAVGFNGTFLPAEIARGGVSVISQSGGVGIALISALADQRCGVAKWIGIGNEAGLSALEALEYLAADPDTEAIAVCFEGLRELGQFLRRAGEVNRSKPVVLLRDGKSGVGLKAAASHTGAMVYAGSVLPSLFSQFGLPETASCRDCAVMLKALSMAPPAQGERAVLLTNTAGPSVLAADTMEALGVQLPPVPEALQRAIDEEAGVPMRLRNPADISSNGLSPRNYGIAASRLLGADEFDLLLGFFSLNAHLQLPEQQLIDAARESGKPVVACFLASQRAFDAYTPRPEEFGIPCFCDAHDAAVASAAILRRGAALRRTSSPSFTLDKERGRACADYLEGLAAGAEDRVLLTERESKTLLSLAGVKLSVPVPAASPEQAADAADRCGYPVALKLESRRITHKSAAGGVRLHLSSRQTVLEAAREMLPRLRAQDADAALTVQPMAGEGFELILGAVRSPLGVLLMAGMGGSFAEALDDEAFCVLPAGREEMRAMLRSLRCARVLYAEDGEPRIDEEGLLSLLGGVAALMERFPRISELEINPCRVTKDRVTVLDARTVLLTNSEKSYIINKEV